MLLTILWNRPKLPLYIGYPYFIPPGNQKYLMRYTVKGQWFCSSFLLKPGPGLLRAHNSQDLHHLSISSRMSGQWKRRLITSVILSLPKWLAVWLHCKFLNISARMLVGATNRCSTDFLHCDFCTKAHREFLKIPIVTIKILNLLSDFRPRIWVVSDYRIYPSKIQ